MELSPTDKADDSDVLHRQLVQLVAVEIENKT